MASAKKYLGGSSDTWLVRPFVAPKPWNSTDLRGMRSGSRVTAAVLIMISFGTLFVAPQTISRAFARPGGLHQGRENTGSVQSAPKDRSGLLLTSYCRHDSNSTFADRANSIQLVNVLRYSASHGYAVQLHGFDISQFAPKGFNKWLQLNETLHDEVNREREWIMVMDNDVMFPNFIHPVESFIANYSDSCDLFVEGDERILGQKDYVNALNTGVLVVRTTARARKFVSSLLSRVEQNCVELLESAAANCTHPDCHRLWARWHLSDQLALGWILEEESKLFRTEAHVCFTSGLQSQGPERRLDVLTKHYAGTSVVLESFADMKLSLQGIGTALFTQVAAYARLMPVRKNSKYASSAWNVWQRKMMLIRQPFHWELQLGNPVDNRWVHAHHFPANASGIFTNLPFAIFLSLFCNESQ